MKKVNIYLDLDQTLISSELLDKNEAEEGDTVYDIEKNKVKARSFHFQNMQGLYVIFERPHLQDFLTFLFENFNVSVWTAASQDYANFIVQNIVIGEHTDRKLKYFLCNYHGCKSSSLFNGSKDLKMLWECYKIPNCNSSNTFILDDNSEVYNTQKENCIIAKEFCYFNENSEKDNFFPQLKKLTQNYILDNNNNQNLSESVKMINSILS